MNITFPQQAPVYLADDPALTFWALVDGESIPCTISAEALEDHFGAASWREEDLERAFESGRCLIEGAAEQLLASVGCRPVMLRSGYFRFSGSGAIGRIPAKQEHGTPGGSSSGTALEKGATGGIGTDTHGVE
jgi:hypothetical protein